MSGTPALASQARPVPELVETASTIVRGTVVEVNGCTSTGDTHSWTFVELEIEQVLLGTLIHAAGEPADRFTIRFKGGWYDDGSRGGLLGTPVLEVGDEVVLILRYDGNGDPYLAPTALAGNGVFRVFSRANDSTAVVDGSGVLLVRGPLGKPLPGPRIAEAVSNWPLARPIDLVGTLADVESYASAVVWSGSGVPQGAWQGSLRLDLDQTVTVHQDGVPTALPIDTVCVARMTGETVGTSLTMSGRCNVQYVGALRVELTGTYENQRWSGTVGLAPAATTGIGAMVQFQEQPWSALDSTEDFIVANGTASSFVGELPPDVTVSVQEPIYSTTDLRAVWTGNRAPMTRSDLTTWLSSLVVATGAAGGPAKSLPLTTAACNPNLAVAGGAP